MTKAITLYLPDPVFEKAQSLAAFQNLNLHDYLLKSITLPEVDLNESFEADDGADAEEQAFRALHPMLVKKYPGQYVAVLNGQLIDRDVDQVSLYQRIRQAYPERFVLIAQIQPVAEEVFHFRSPRILDEGRNGSL